MNNTITNTRYTNISDAPLLTHAQEIELGKIIQNGKGAKVQKAIDTFIVSNLRLVAKIVNGEYGGFADSEDLMSEGAIGLYEAAKRFKPTKKVKFSTYAAFWIHQRIRQYIEKSYLIKLSTHAHSMSAKLKRMSETIEAEIGREPTKEELMEMTGISEDTLDLYAQGKYSTVSIDAPSSSYWDRDSDTATLGGRLVDPQAVAPDEAIEASHDTQYISKFLKYLTNRERFVVTLRYGLNGVPRQYHLQEIGEMYGITRERIRQIQNEALDKLRSKIRRSENKNLQCV